MERGVSCSRHEQITIPVDADLELRGACIVDADEVYAAIMRNRDHLRRWLPWLKDDFSAAHNRGFIEAREADNAARKSLTTWIYFRGQLAGAIALHEINDPNRNTSIGYWIDQDHTGRGIMTRACRAIVTEGFRNYNLHRIEIRCATGNDHSSAIPRRLGFTEEGVLHEAEWLYDHWVDLRVFSMLSQNWNMDTRITSASSP